MELPDIFFSLRMKRFWQNIQKKEKNIWQKRLHWQHLSAKRAAQQMAMWLSYVLTSENRKTPLKLWNVTAKAYRKRLGQRTGWLLTSWLVRFRPDPLKRLGLTEAADDTGVHHSSLPALDAAHKAMANTGVRAYASALSEGMPVEWANEIADTTETVAANVPEALDRAIQKTELPAQPSGGWFIFSFLQWVALLMALVGVLWYLAVAFLPGIVVQFWTKGYPEVEGWPVPTLLIAGGILLGILLGLFTSAFGGIIGASVRRRTTKALTQEVSAMAETTVVAPLHAVRERYARVLELIAAARA